MFGIELPKRRRIWTFSLVITSRYDLYLGATSKDARTSANSETRIGVD
jgi:hypothetical protein